MFYARRRKRSERAPQLALLTMLALGLAAVGLALAAKPGSGGGNGTVPPGTIYFEQEDNDSYKGRSMNADGKGKAASIRGEPSYQLHGGTRWFLTSIVTSTDPDGAEHAELLAVAENGDVVPLGVEAAQFVGSRWAKDDSFLSFVAILDAPEGRSAGLFAAEVDWSSGVPVIGAPEKVLHVNLYDDYYPDIWFWDWSPSGDEVVYQYEAHDSNNDPVYSLEVLRLFADGTTATRSLVSDALYPQWSPDGSRVAFQNYADGAIWTIQPDGTGAAKVSSPKWPAFHTEPSWSPDSQHLTFTQITRDKEKGAYLSTYTYDILRISASGEGVTNLTGDTDADCFAIAWR